MAVTSTAACCFARGSIPSSKEVVGGGGPASGPAAARVASSMSATARHWVPCDLDRRSRRSQLSGGRHVAAAAAASEVFNDTSAARTVYRVRSSPNPAGLPAGNSTCPAASFKFAAFGAAAHRRRRRAWTKGSSARSSLSSAYDNLPRVRCLSSLAKQKQPARRDLSQPELKQKNGGQYHQRLTKKGGGALVVSAKVGDVSGTEDPNGSDESKSLEIMRKFSEQYAKRTGTYFCVDKSVTAVVIKGLAEHKDQLGAPLCPCRHYDDKMAEATQGFWNCPCVPMRERKECHCMLFLTEDSDFVGTDQKISMEEMKGLGVPF